MVVWYGHGMFMVWYGLVLYDMVLCTFFFISCHCVALFFVYQDLFICI